MALHHAPDAPADDRAGATDAVPVPTIAVVAPSPLLTVTIEAGARGDELHLHPGGQGVWVGRMVRALGARARLVGVFGGEIGDVAEHLVRAEGIDVRAVQVSGGNGAYVHDRRDGERREVAEVEPHCLTRHEVDDWYSQAVVECLDADVAMVTGTILDEVLPGDIYRRLCSDLSRNGTPVVADLSGPALMAALDGGVRALKISHEELIEAGLADGDGAAQLLAGIDRLRAMGVELGVVSRQAEPALAFVGEARYEVVAPALEPVDATGGGDAMAACLAVGLARRQPVLEVLALLGAAGSLNVTRRGLASAGGEEVERLAAHVQVRALAPA